MLEWINGNAPNGHGDEAPDTPAHIFAARAFRTALFGTPAPAPDARRDTMNGGKTREPECNVAPSPTKGILLTPGTITMKRKSVSFGADSRAGVDGTVAEKKSLETVEEAEEPGSREAKDKPAASKPLRRALFNKVKPFTSQESALFGNTRPSQRAAQIPASKPEVKATQEPQEQVAKAKPSQPELAADVTVDLEQPRSVSGRHWMKEYKRDHATSKAEMKKLIRYSQNAKTQAMSKEQEATELREKLNLSQTRVEELERELAKIKEERRASHEMKRAKPDQPEEKKDNSASSHPELEALRKAAKEANFKAAKLQQENDDFRQTILRVKDEMAKYESRHKDWVAQRKRKDEKHAAQRKALKEKVINYRNQLQEEFDSYQVKTESEKAILLQEIEQLRSGSSAASAYRKDTDMMLPPNDPLRDLLVRVHEKSPLKTAEAGLFRADDFGEIESPAPERRKSAKSRTSLDRLKAILKEDDHPQRSSPTILDDNSRQGIPQDRDIKASRKSTTTMRTRNAQEKHGSETAKPSLARHPRENHDAVANDENALPGIKSGTRKTSSARENAGTPRKDIRVRSRHGLTAGSNSGLTPEREAAARLRIAQRSAQKQRSKKFFFEDDDGDWLTESRGILAERALNRA